MEDWEYQEAQNDQSCHEPLKTAEVGGIIATNNLDLIYFYKEAASINLLVDCIEDEYQEDRIQSEGFGFMTHKYGITIGLTVTT